MQRIDSIAEMEEKHAVQIKELQDLYRRSLADAENLRVRAKKEVDDASNVNLNLYFILVFNPEVC